MNFAVHIGSAKSSNKRDAKHEAARIILLKLDDRSEHLISYTPQLKTPVNTDSLEVDPDVSGNPVGELNDLCLRAHIPPPEYEVGT